MADLLQPTNSNRENLETFIAEIEDEDLQQLLKSHLDTILKIGSPGGQDNRRIFFKALQNIVDKRINGADA